MSFTKFNPETDVPSLTGKVILITGGTAGLGAGSIKAFANHDPAQIIFTGRNEKSANVLVEEVRKSSPNVKLNFLRCDISSLASVQESANAVKAATNRLDILMLNAGIMAVPAATSVDGYEIQWATNQMGHALLVKLLLPLLQQTAAIPGADVRVINMSSIAYEQAPKQGIEFSTLRSDQVSLGMLGISRWARYGQSKLAQILYTDELAKHYPDITWISVHPGFIITGLFDNVDFVVKLPVLIMSLGKRTPVEEGHYQQCWAATCPKSALRNGEYYEPIGRLGKRSTKLARDTNLSAPLWEWTQTELKAWN